MRAVRPEVDRVALADLVGIRPLFFVVGVLSGAMAVRPAAFGLGALRGKRIVTVVPSPGLDSTSITPPWSSTMRRTMAIPRPVPPSKAVEKGVKTRAISSSV